MGQHFRYYFFFDGVVNVAVNLALFELHQTAPATSLPIYVWDFQMTILNNDAAATTAENIILKLQREATLIHTGGSAGVVTPVVGGQATGTTVRFAPTGLTSAGATATGNLAGFACTGFAVGAQQSFVLKPPEKYTGDTYSPICVVKGTEQLALVAALAIPVSTLIAITGSIGWSEGP